MRLLLLLLPSAAIVGALIALAKTMDAAGISFATRETAGRFYFVLLCAAPLLISPLARRAGAGFAARLVLSLLPGFLWWLTEIGVRLAWHSLAEAVWLVFSPFNAIHLWFTLVAFAIADSVGDLFVETEGRRKWIVRSLSALAALLLAGGAIAVSIPVFLSGYRSAFQADLLPQPERLPGRLNPANVAVSKDAPRPNIVFILSDDHRSDFVGYEDHPFVQTPAIDRLAEEGVRFSRAYVTSSLCSPSRATYLTGTTPHRHGVWNNFTPWSDENRTFLEYLHAAGYRTAFVGKWHMPGEGVPALRGVDHFVTFTNLGGQGIYEWCPLVVDGREEASRTRYIATELTDRALAWLEKPSEKPFALFLSHKNVHADFVPDEPERGSLANVAVELPGDAGPWTHLSRAQYTHFNFNPLDTAVRRYAEAIASMDREIGRVLDWLDAAGRTRDTLVIYTSDNGYQWGERGLVDKRWPYETSIRVPLVARYPAAAAAGVRSDRVVTNLDVAPTVLALAGVGASERMQGRDLTPLLENPSASFRDGFLYTYFFEPPYPTPTANALVTERYKWIDYEGLPDELYDLERDPDERTNLAGSVEHRKIRARLERALAEAIAATPEAVAN